MINKDRVLVKKKKCKKLKKSLKTRKKEKDLVNIRKISFLLNLISQTEIMKLGNSNKGIALPEIEKIYIKLNC